MWQDAITKKTQVFHSNIKLKSQPGKPISKVLISRFLLHWKGILGNLRHSFVGLSKKLCGLSYAGLLIPWFATPTIFLWVKLIWASWDLTSQLPAVLQLQVFKSRCPISGRCLLAKWSRWFSKRITRRQGECEGQSFYLTLDISQQTCIEHSFYAVHMQNGH